MMKNHTPTPISSGVTSHMHTPTEYLGSNFDSFWVQVGPEKEIRIEGDPEAPDRLIEGVDQ
eukprot:3632913-Amphidinium_carterae.1